MKVGHVEAGLRSENTYLPYPEEVDRCLTGRLANIHFAPIIRNKQNLLNENIGENNIVVTGNTVIDVLLDVIDENYKFQDENVNLVYKQWQYIT